MVHVTLSYRPIEKRDRDKKIFVLQLISRHSNVDPVHKRMSRGEFERYDVGNIIDERKIINKSLAQRVQKTAGRDYTQIWKGNRNCSDKHVLIRTQC